MGAAAFSISILVLLFIGRTFNNYYLRVADDGRGGGRADLGRRAGGGYLGCCRFFLSSSAYRYERPVR